MESPPCALAVVVEAAIATSAAVQHLKVVSRSSRTMARVGEAW
jgi:hypothetical protein